MNLHFRYVGSTKKLQSATIKLQSATSDKELQWPTLTIKVCIFLHSTVSEKWYFRFIQSRCRHSSLFLLMLLMIGINNRTRRSFSRNVPPTKERMPLFSWKNLRTSGIINEPSWIVETVCLLDAINLISVFLIFEAFYMLKYFVRDFSIWAFFYWPSIFQ